MAKRKWNRKRNHKSRYYFFPLQEPWCRAKEVFVEYDRVPNQCLTRGLDSSICESFCIVDKKTHQIFDLRQFYKEIYLGIIGQNGKNGYKKRKLYCSHHGYYIPPEKAVKKCLTCGPYDSICRDFYVEDPSTGNMINPRVFYKEEFLAGKF